MIPAEYILMKKLGKHYLIDSYEKNLQKDNSIKKCLFLIGRKNYFLNKNIFNKT